MITWFLILVIDALNAAGPYPLGRVYEIIWGKHGPYSAISINSIKGDSGTAGPFGSVITSYCTTVSLANDDYINYIEKWYGTCIGCDGDRQNNNFVRALRITTNNGNQFTCDEGQGMTNAQYYKIYDFRPNNDYIGGYVSGVEDAHPTGEILDWIEFLSTNFTQSPTLHPSGTPTETPTKAPTDNTKYVLADTNVCYTDGAKTCSAGNNIIFSAPKSGIIKGIKLVHESGGVGCHGSSVMTNWGCADNDPMTSAYITMLLIKVTNEATYDGLVYYPVNGETDDINYWNDLSDRSCPNQYNTAIPEHYQVSGYSSGSPELILINPIYTVSVNDKFMLGYGESYSECVHQDNPGWSGYASVYFLYESQNCEEEQQIKHINWHQLQNAVDNSAQVPYSSFNINFNPNTLEVTFDVDLEYIGMSADGNFDLDYTLGTTYVIGFDSFSTTGHLINEPGNCQNRIFESFQVGSFDEWWGYSEYPYFSTNDLGSNIYLSYPPPSEYWTLSIAEDTCSPINYLGVFSWNELSECVDFNGNELIEIKDDGSTITLSGTLYVNIVSPYTMDTTDSGIYRTFPLIQQDFEISITKQINVIGSTGIDLFITSIIGIFEDEIDQSFELSIFTQTADYMQLTNPMILNTPFGNIASISVVTTSCLTASTYTCGQIFTITVNQTEISCPPADMSGVYDIAFDVECRSNEPVCDTFIADNEGTLIALQVTSNFIDNTCEPEMYQVIFNGLMTFYDDVDFLIAHNENYVIGQDIIYVEVNVNFPDDGSGDNYNIFNVVIDNVFVCTADDQFDLTQNLNQQNGIGGCLSNEVDSDGEYIVIENGIEKNYNAHIIEYNEETNVVRFSFLTFDIGRTKMYVHVQLTLEMINGNGRRRILNYRLLSSDTQLKSDQIRHFIGSTLIENEIQTNVFSTKYTDDSENNNSDGVSDTLMISNIKILFIFILSITFYILH